MMRQDVFETRQQLYISVLRDAGARQWMMGDRRFETLSRNVGHAIQWRVYSILQEQIFQLYSHESQRTRIIQEPQI